MQHPGHAMGEKGAQRAVGGNVLPIGSRVRVTSSGPFRGLRGTIRTVDLILPHEEGEEPFCFYQITLEGAHIKEPIWFACDEVESVALLSGVLQGRH